MSIALWIARSLLATAFLGSGGMKVFAYQKYRQLTEKKGPSGISQSLATFIGIAEIAGALGVILPMALSIVPGLGVAAAVGLGLIMLLATGYHLRRHESLAVPIVLFLLAAFVAFGRLA